MKERLKEYRDYLVAKGYKRPGIEKIERAILQYFEYAQKMGLDIYNITIREAEAYREALCTARREGKAYVHSTINSKLSSLRGYYRYLGLTRQVLTNSFAYVGDLRKSEVLPRGILAQKQMGALLELLPENTKRRCMEKAVIELLYSTGMRIGEAAALRSSDIDTARGVVIIRDSKSRQERMCVLTEYAKELLALLIKTTEPKDKPVFEEIGQGRALRAVINQALSRTSKKAALPHISCHGIRHSIATHLLENGADIRAVQEFLGHRHIRETERYTRVNMESLRELIRTLHPRG